MCLDKNHKNQPYYALTKNPPMRQRNLFTQKKSNILFYTYLHKPHVHLRGRGVSQMTISFSKSDHEVGKGSKISKIWPRGLWMTPLFKWNVYKPRWQNFGWFWLPSSLCRHFYWSFEQPPPLSFIVVVCSSPLISNYGPFKNLKKIDDVFDGRTLMKFFELTGFNVC